MSSDISYYDSNPIDTIESLAESKNWEFDRVDEDQITMMVTGDWKTYSVTIHWSSHLYVLRLLSTFALESPTKKLPDLYRLLNLVNDQIWTGTFTYWEEQKLMLYRYGLILSDEHVISEEQTKKLLLSAVEKSDQFYPAFISTVFSDLPPEQSIGLAMDKAFGRA